MGYSYPTGSGGERRDCKEDVRLSFRSMRSQGRNRTGNRGSAPTAAAGACKDSPSRWHLPSTGSGRVQQPCVTSIAVDRDEVRRAKFGIDHGNKRACAMSIFVRAVCRESGTHGSSRGKGREALPISTVFRQ